MGENLEDRFAWKVDEVWKALNRKATEDLQKAFYNTTVGSPMGSVLVAGIEAVERIRRACPVEWPGDRILGLEVQTSNLLPPDVAYMVPRPMPQYNIPFEPINFMDEDYEALKFKVLQDYSVRLGVPRSPVLTCDIGGFEEPEVVWLEPEAPAQPLSGWQWLIVVGVLSWILCAMARVM